MPGLRGPTPQICFDDPRAGSLGIRPLAEVQLDPSDTRTLDQLAAAYPRPVEAS
jgi:hypothetical protein